MPHKLQKKKLNGKVEGTEPQQPEEVVLTGDEILKLTEMAAMREYKKAQSLAADD